MPVDFTLMISNETYGWCLNFKALAPRKRIPWNPKQPVLNMDVWWNNKFSCNDLDSSNWNNHFKFKWMFRVAGITYLPTSPFSSVSVSCSASPNSKNHFHWMELTKVGLFGVYRLGNWDCYHEMGIIHIFLIKKEGGVSWKFRSSCIENMACQRS